ncbi:endonuclease/exonuclease/phosphatase family protein [Octadecabacter sp. G9-8]|uniref:Endonuclease/exonuclease/phosphatase family protein n=1 Tax=Octadecabacter dasysiphoniae TaxID=2909341 RepID=A0ABS9CVG0_9RHOB|nr:endonuclease/exonuclease/phosphatase family protein [Octadecabacter dasysiphoniae]MCF2870390.1 endonuclease/exonuclease/phosphatase family protein [Octadecabacter dasysiphoniae]
MQETQIRIASYNMRKARGLDQKRRPERTLQVLNGLDADVIVLQEADKRLGVRPSALPRGMIAAETDFEVVRVSRNDVSIGWHGNAILARKGLDVMSVERLDLPGFEPRGAVRVQLDLGDGLTVVATHLGLLRRDRQAQLAELNRVTAADKHCVIAGDFNEWSDTKGLEPLAGRFETHSPGRSFHARRPIVGLDRFALSHGVTLRDAGVDQSPLARVASDHLPIWSDIAVPAVTC